MFYNVQTEDNGLFPNFHFLFTFTNSIQLPGAKPPPLVSWARSSVTAGHGHIHTDLGTLFPGSFAQSHVSDSCVINITKNKTQHQICIVVPTRTCRTLWGDLLRGTDFICSQFKAETSLRCFTALPFTFYWLNRKPYETKFLPQTFHLGI